MRTPTLRTVLLAPALAALLLAAGDARALSFVADFGSTFYQTAPGDTYADLLAAHEAATPLTSVTMTGFEGVSAQIEAGVGGDYSMRLTAAFEVAVSGQYEFQVGADWGRGGVAAVLDDASDTVIQELVRTDDIWWALDWNNPDVFTTSLWLDAGSSYRFVWLGFEGCCAGATTIRFAVDGGAFQTLNETNLGPLVTPEPATALFLGAGLAALAARGRAVTAR